MCFDFTLLIGIDLICRQFAAAVGKLESWQTACFLLSVGFGHRKWFDIMTIAGPLTHITH